MLISASPYHPVRGGREEDLRSLPPDALRDPGLLNTTPSGVGTARGRCLFTPRRAESRQPRTAQCIRGNTIISPFSFLLPTPEGWKSLAADRAVHPGKHNNLPFYVLSTHPGGVEVVSRGSRSASGETPTGLARHKTAVQELFQTLDEGPVLNLVERAADACVTTLPPHRHGSRSTCLPAGSGRYCLAIVILQLPAQ